jgi:type VI secretion system secreted protein VgrG
MLTRPRPAGDGATRGNGVELATNESAAIRSAKALLISAWERLDACGQQLSCEEHIGLMQSCLDLFKTLGSYAGEHNAFAPNTPPQAELQEAIKQWGSKKPDEPTQDTAPAVAVTAPQGLSFGTPKAIVSYAGLNIDSVAHRHLQMTAGQSCNINAGEGISLFAHRNGVRQIAHYGKFLVQSQHDDVVINAAKTLTLTASDGAIRLMAKEIHLIAEDGSFAKLVAGITLGTNAKVDVKAAKFAFDGPSTMHTDLPYFAGEGKAPPRWIALHYVDPSTGEGLAGADYEIHFEDGPTVTGKLDAQGKARHENVLDKPVKKVVYKPRPAKEDEEAAALDELLSAGD